MIQKKLGARIKELRKLKGLSQEGLALEAGLDRTYITSVENGRRNISISNIQKIAKALGLSIRVFFNNDKFEV